MIRILQRFFFLSLFFALPLAAFSEIEDEDAARLLKQLSKKNADTTLIRIYNELTEYYIGQRNDSAKLYNQRSLELSGKTKTYNYSGTYFKASMLIKSGDPKQALPLIEQAFELAKKQNNTVDIGRTHYIYAVYYNTTKDFNKALDNGLKALKIREKLNDTSQIISSLTMIGQLYKSNNKVTDALSYYLKAARLAELTQNESAQFNAYINLGTLYQNSSDNRKAMNFYRKALIINHTDKDPHGYAICYSKLGSAWAQEKNMDSAYYYTYKTYEMHKATNEEPGLITSMQKLGGILSQKGDYKKALLFMDSAYAIGVKRKDTMNMCSITAGKANIYLMLNQPNQAIQLLQKSLAMYPTKDHYLNLAMQNEKLSTAYKLKGDYKKAYDHYVIYKNLLDKEAEKNDVKKQTELKLAYEFDQIQEKQREEALAKEIENNLKLASEKKNRYYLISFLALAVLIIVIAIRSYISKQRSNHKLEKQNVQLEFQKRLVEQKNKEINDSINYAKYIQTACLPDEEQLKSCFNDYFLLFKPRDVVSGDFFWSAKTNDKIFVAVADCTGHGVPGAIMSMIGSMLLNEIFYVKHIYSPEKILSELNRLVKLTLKQEGVSSSRDGMDIAFCVWDIKNDTLAYAGANRPLYLFRSNGEFVEYKASKLSIGGNTSLEQDYQLNTIQVQTGDRIVLSTDGFADQFGGGGKEKKLNTKFFKQKLGSIAHQTSLEQQKQLDHFFETWKGNNEQTDDVLVFSFAV